VALITARAGSKRLPKKNIKLLLNKPLVAWTADAALSSASVSRVIISTDDAEASEIVRRMGVEVPFVRPAELAQDSTSHMAVLEHFMSWFKAEEGHFPEYLLLLQPTSPLRIADDIEGAIEVGARENADAVVGVCEVKRHPTVQWELSEAGRLRETKRSAANFEGQSSRRVYAPNGAIYYIRGSVLAAKKTLYPENSVPFFMTEDRSIDIDTIWDFKLAELILKDKYEAGREK
jgi:N-acylneuraminate cytidylyltransferase/CMP-N,N'-diacetyllegionaminic acid synthase